MIEHRSRETKNSFKEMMGSIDRILWILKYRIQQTIIEFTKKKRNLGVREIGSILLRVSLKAFKMQIIPKTLLLFLPFSATLSERENPSSRETYNNVIIDSFTPLDVDLHRSNG